MRYILLIWGASIAPTLLLGSFAVTGAYTFLGLFAIFGYFYATAKDHESESNRGRIGHERQMEAIDRFVAEVKHKNVANKK